MDFATMLDFIGRAAFGFIAIATILGVVSFFADMAAFWVVGAAWVGGIAFGALR